MVKIYHIFDLHAVG